MRHITLPLLASVILLGGCSTPADEPAEPTVASSPAARDSAPETVEPTPEPSPAPVDADLDLQDGIRTNDFGRMPEQVGGLVLVNRDTNPAEYRATIVYEAPDKSSAAQFNAYFSQLGGEPEPVLDVNDEGFRAAFEGAVTAFEQKGADVETRSLEAGGLEWECIEAVGPEDVDSVLCVAVRYGRALELQYLTGHAEDGDAWRDAYAEVLTDIGEGVVALA